LLAAGDRGWHTAGMTKLCPAASLPAFRRDVYRCLERRADALFEVMDALATAGPLPSLAHLSCAPAHRRGWASLYDALTNGRIDVPRLRALVADHPSDGGAPVYAVDASTWPRCDAETSPERGFYYHPSRHSAGQPIVAGWLYQWVAQLGFAPESWTAPLDVRRVRPTENVHAVAAEQIRALLPLLPPLGPAPTFVFDAGYDPEALARELGTDGGRLAVLVRLRRDRCFYADPVPVPRPKGGRPRRHGAKFACRDEGTWWPPTAEHREGDERYGQVRVRAWAGVHAKSQNHPGKGSRRTRAYTRGTLILVEVGRLPTQTRQPQRLWLWWHGPDGATADLAHVWRAYVRRFDLEHTFRFMKQGLNWVTPRVRHPAQADRWTWLVLLAYTLLRLARPLVADRRLPWERPRPAGRLTPSRVQRAFLQLLGALGTPASPPQPCGRSPGRPPGRRSGPAPRFPALKKAA
jgi:DDE superfamily endonuclease